MEVAERHALEAEEAPRDRSTFVVVFVRCTIRPRSSLPLAETHVAVVEVEQPQEHHLV